MANMDPVELRNLLEKSIAERGKSGWCLFCGAVRGVEAMANPFEKVDMEQARELIASGVINDLAARLPDKLTKSSWCLFCGASRAMSPGELVTQPGELKDEMIEKLTEDILKLCK